MNEDKKNKKKGEEEKKKRGFQLGEMASFSLHVEANGKTAN